MKQNDMWRHMKNLRTHIRILWIFHIERYVYKCEFTHTSAHSTRIFTQPFRCVRVVCVCMRKHTWIFLNEPWKFDFDSHFRAVGLSVKSVQFIVCVKRHSIIDTHNEIKIKKERKFIVATKFDFNIDSFNKHIFYFKMISFLIVSLLSILVFFL